eukprot:UN4876
MAFCGALFTSVGACFIVAEGVGVVFEALEGAEKFAEGLLTQVSELEKTWHKVATAILLGPSAIALGIVSFIFLLSYRDVFASPACKKILPVAAGIHLVAMLFVPRIWWIAMKLSFLVSPVAGWAMTKNMEPRPRLAPEPAAPTEGVGADEPAGDAS